MTAPLHTPPPEVVARAQITAFRRACEAHTGLSLPDYVALHAFSVADVGRFWSLLLEWSALPWEGQPDPACTAADVEHARFFPGVRLNYAEALLSPRWGDDRTAVTALEEDAEDGVARRVTRGELRARVASVAAGLRALDVGPGDRVAAIARHTLDPIVCALAAACVGATWSSVSPDLGTASITSRFSQVAPTVLLYDADVTYQGLRRPLDDLVREVAAALPSLRVTVALDRPVEGLPGPTTLSALASTPAPDGPPWQRLPFDHPLFVLFSSGTTGRPKCIVHGHGGTLLTHVKEHRLHADLGPGDVLLFQTSTGWMMWNWQLSALASGAEIVVRDGSAAFPDASVLLRVVRDHGVTVFGTSPPWIQLLRDSGVDARAVGAPRLRQLQSTGSVLPPAHYDWAREHFGDVPLYSVSGGTDIIGCFVLGSPDRPVWSGESPCAGLGFDLRAMTPDGPSRVGTGELVCAAPFPSRPVGFLNDPDGARLHGAYYAENPGLWTHGDLVELTERGTARIIGRSDGVMNIRGVRIGPAEIYDALRGMPEIAEAMAVDQDTGGGRGERRIVLLVVLAAGVEADRALLLRIKRAIRDHCSQTHVPALVAAVDELPTTHNGKRSERAAQDAVNGRPIRNLEALRNPAAAQALATDPRLAPPGR